MSTNILETETFSITRFFGGTSRGVCYQISMAGSPGYVQLTKDDAELLRSTLAVELSGVPSEATKKAICPGCHSGDPKKHGYIVGRPATFDNVCFGEFHELAPSEATPSKENAPPEWPTLPPPDPFDAGFQAGLELGKFQTPKPLLLCNLCGMRRDEHIDTDHRFLDGRTSPAPEVQGTPTKGDRSHCVICDRADNCHLPTGMSDDGTHVFVSKHDARKINVGTPQKETPPDVRVHGCAEHGEVSVAFCEAVGCTAPKNIPVTAEAEGVQGK